MTPRADGTPVSVAAARAPLVMVMVALAIVAITTTTGCASKKVALRSTPNTPLVEQLGLTSFSGPKPSGRTTQLLRVYNLADASPPDDPRPLLVKLQEINDREPSADIVYAMSELAFLGGKRAERYDKRVALDLHYAAVLHAYDYLFDRRYYNSRNPYDPQYRGACDLYNAALEAALRIVRDERALLPGLATTINTASGVWDVTCMLQSTPQEKQENKGAIFASATSSMSSASFVAASAAATKGTSAPLRPEEFERFEFVSDYEVTGLKNQYRTHGLGVPLIAIRRCGKDDSAAAKYYPPDISFPVTAFLRPVDDLDPTTGAAGRHKQCVLELYDSLVSTETMVAGRRVPLGKRSDHTLGLFPFPPELDILATVGLLRPEMLLEYRPDRPEPIMGLYMAQPYEPDKIPVIMVHGLWSSPMTWMEMFNDLRSHPELRQRYQFWFYLYPTGQPFWLIAAQLRHDLDQLKQQLDPQHREPALDQMVLGRPQHGWPGIAVADLVGRRRILAAGQPSTATGHQGRARCAPPACRAVLLPAESVDQARDYHRHAVPRQRFSNQTTQCC